MLKTTSLAFLTFKRRTNRFVLAPVATRESVLRFSDKIRSNRPGFVAQPLLPESHNGNIVGIPNSAPSPPDVVSHAIEQPQDDTHRREVYQQSYSMRLKGAAGKSLSVPITPASQLREHSRDELPAFERLAILSQQNTLSNVVQPTLLRCTSCFLTFTGIPSHYFSSLRGRTSGGKQLKSCPRCRSHRIQWALDYVNRSLHTR